MLFPFFLIHFLSDFLIIFRYQWTLLIRFFWVNFLKLFGHLFPKRFSYMYLSKRGALIWRYFVLKLISNHYVKMFIFLCLRQFTWSWKFSLCCFEVCKRLGFVENIDSFRWKFTLYLIFTFITLSSYLLVRSSHTEDV